MPSPPTPAGGGGLLPAVTATSARSAWAAGKAPWYGRTLIVHWNGTAWKQVPTPTPRRRLPFFLRRSCPPPRPQRLGSRHHRLRQHLDHTLERQNLELTTTGVHRDRHWPGLAVTTGAAPALAAQHPLTSRMTAAPGGRM